MSELAMRPVCGDVHNEAHIANETGVIKFSSGNSMEPERGVIGIAHDLHFFEGLGDVAHIHGADDRIDSRTAEDLSELADIMIDRWQRFKVSLGEKA